MTWLKCGWTEADVLQWMRDRYAPKVIPLLCLQGKKDELVMQERVEDDALARFAVDRKRRLLRTLRRGDYANPEIARLLKRKGKPSPPASPFIYSG